MQFLYSGHYYEGQLTDYREFITINYPPPLGFWSPPPMAHLAPCLTLTGRPCFYSRIFWGLCTLFSTSDCISTRVLDACMQFQFCSLRKHETVSFADSSGPDPGGAGGRAPLSPSETCHQTSDQYVQQAMGFPDFSFCFEFSKCMFFWAHLQLLLLR